jgi:hypothetical protein
MGVIMQGVPEWVMQIEVACHDDHFIVLLIDVSM